MPLHDWTDERGWDRAHPFWLAYLIEWIQPRLPEGYKAFLGGVPALTVASGNGKPDVSVRQWGEQPPAAAVATETAVLEPDLEVSVSFRLDPQRAVHIDFHGQLIAAIELVSPRNKDRVAAKETYSSRYLGYLRLGVHCCSSTSCRARRATRSPTPSRPAWAWSCPRCRRRSPRPTASGRSSRSARKWAASWACGAARCGSASPCRRCRCH